MKNCEHYEILLSSWLDDQLDRAGQVELLDHVVRCDSCREFYLDARGLDGLVAAVRTPAGAERPSLEVWKLIKRDARRSEETTMWQRLPLWARQAAAVFVVAIGLGVLMWNAPFTVAPPPGDVEIRLGEDAGNMTEDRFIELTREVLRADRRYHLALYQVMDQVVRETAVQEASFEDTTPPYKGDEVSEVDITRNPA